MPASTNVSDVFEGYPIVYIIASGELALDSCSYQAAGIMNSYLLAVSGVTYILCACNQSEFDVVMMVVVMVKKFSLLRAASSPHQNRE